MLFEYEDEQKVNWILFKEIYSWSFPSFFDGKWEVLFIEI